MPFYDIYETSDGKHLSVGALEPQFFDALVTAARREGRPARARSRPDRYDEMRKVFTETFLQRTQAEWVEIFEGTDACVGRDHPDQRGRRAPAPQGPRDLRRDATAWSSRSRPRGSRARRPRSARRPARVPAQHTREALTAWGIADIDGLLDRGVAVQVD